MSDENNGAHIEDENEVKAFIAKANQRLNSLQEATDRLYGLYIRAMGAQCQWADKEPHFQTELRIVLNILEDILSDGHN
ncbi:MAG: hypothetical protein HQK59_06160 [Deltaproteobacteria bacterium]|nr:hypothetical protein [Deltaproteobacteria bacterium]